MDAVGSPEKQQRYDTDLSSSQRSAAGSINSARKEGDFVEEEKLNQNSMF
jgi:hypothetical protein